MILPLWDASALVKRYTPEVGSGVVERLFAEIPASRMATTFTAYAEAYSVLARKRNRGEIAADTFRAAISLIQSEVLLNPDFNLLTVGDAAVLAGVEYVDRYALNASDAAILVVFLRYAASQKVLGHTGIIVTSDRRLVRAARSEGCPALDPEEATPGEIDTLLAG